MWCPPLYSNWSRPHPQQRFWWETPGRKLNEGIRQYDSSDTGHSDNVNIAAEHQEPTEVLSQLDNTSNSPVYGEYKCC